MLAKTAELQMQCPAEDSNQHSGPKMLSYCALVRNRQAGLGAQGTRHIQSLQGHPTAIKVYSTDD